MPSIFQSPCTPNIGVLSHGVSFIGRISPSMVSVYEIQPSSSAENLGHVLDVAGVQLADGGERIRSLRVQRVDVYPQQAKWIVYVDSIPPDVMSTVANLGGAMAQAIPSVAEVIIRPTSVPSTDGNVAEETEEAAAKPAPATPTEVTEAGDVHDVANDVVEDVAADAGSVADSGDDGDDYMDAIMDLVRSGIPDQSPPNGSGSFGAGPGGNATGSRTLLGSAIKQQPVKMETLDDEERSVTLAGEIFSLETRTMRSGRRMVLFDFTDGTDSLSAKVFIDEKDEVPALKEGMWVRARGRL